MLGKLTHSVMSQSFVCQQVLVVHRSAFPVNRPFKLLLQMVQGVDSVNPQDAIVIRHSL